MVLLQPTAMFFIEQLYYTSYIFINGHITLLHMMIVIFETLFTGSRTIQVPRGRTIRDLHRELACSRAESVILRMYTARAGCHPCASGGGSTCAHLLPPSRSRHDTARQPARTARTCEEPKNYPPPLR